MPELDYNYVEIMCVYVCFCTDLSLIGQRHELLNFELLRPRSKTANTAFADRERCVRRADVRERRVPRPNVRECRPRS